MPEPTTVQYLIQGGAVGLALASLWVIYKLVSNHDSHLLSSLDKNSEAWIKNAQALTRLTDKLDEMDK